MKPVTPIAIIIAATLATAAGAQSLTPVPFSAVKFEGEFWGQRLEIIRSSTLQANRHQCNITGRLTNFDRASGKEKSEFQGLLFNDSDVYKMLEGWAYLLATDTDAARRADLESKFDAEVARIAAAQQPDGYINSYYTVKVGLDKRWSREEHDHETYCIGHLIEAGIAHFEATGKRTLLDVAIKAADHIGTIFGKGKLEEPSGHEEIEIALIKLSMLTKDSKYLDLAQWFIDQRGTERLNAKKELSKPWGDYSQDHVPLRMQMEAAGHAVRAGYLYTAAADLARLRPDSNYAPALDALWTDVTQRRMYITGGIGPSAHNEGFTTPYDLPTLSAYQETCASISLAMWAQRMFLLHGNASYMDAFERSVYNAVLAGVSLDGSKFFYVNPLASRGDHTRKEWFSCACCPPNVLRFFASIGGSFYASSGNDCLVTMYGQSESTITTASGKATIRQITSYPWDGAIHIDYDLIEGTSGNLKIRKPDWCSSLSLKVNGIETRATVGTDGFITIAPGPHAAIDLLLEMPVRRAYADPKVKAVLGSVALSRGPIIYALEWDSKKQSLGTCTLSGNAPIKIAKRNFSSTPFVALDVELTPWKIPETQTLYSTPESTATITVEAIPYFMWNNRGSRSMQVFTPETPQSLPPAPLSGVVATTSFVGNGDGVNALFDQLIPTASNDHSIPRYTAWPHKGTTEWIQYEFNTPREISRTSVYWFDDTGRGECRIPQSWEVEYLDGQTWKKIQGTEELPAHLNQFDTATFPRVLANGIRIKMQLQKDFSAGVLEWSFAR